MLAAACVPNSFPPPWPPVPPLFAAPSPATPAVRAGEVLTPVAADAAAPTPADLRTNRCNCAAGPARGLVARQGAGDEREAARVEDRSAQACAAAASPGGAAIAAGAALRV